MTGARAPVFPDTIRAVFGSLVIRNVTRNLRRLLPMLVVLVIAFSALLVGNGVLAATGDALYRTYTGHVSGDLSVSASGDSNFTIFGSDALLVGEYLVPPTLIGFDELRSTVDSLPQVRSSAAVVSAAARVEIGRRRADQHLFGVDFDRYRDLFPDLEVVAGSVPAPGERGILVQAGWGGTGADTADLIGRRALLTVAHDLNFTFREVRVTGVFRYPIQDESLDRVALLDPDTARALNGYVYGAGGVVELPPEEEDLFASEVDALFGEAESWDEPDETDEPDEWSDDSLVDDDQSDILADLDEFFAASRDEADQARQTVEGAWNFLLVSLYDRRDLSAVTRELQRRGFTEDEGFLVRDWRRTVGGTAQLTWYLQVFFNVGLLFVAFGAAIITTNALVLSVLERTAEIGTMRALGATRGRVAAMITAETVIVVAGAALVGIALGQGVLALLNRAGIVPENPYLAILFGGGAMRGETSARLITEHLLAGLALALVAVVYPLKRALGISPVKAMAL